MTSGKTVVPLPHFSSIIAIIDGPESGTSHFKSSQDSTPIRNGVVSTEIENDSQLPPKTFSQHEDDLLRTTTSIVLVLHAYG